MKKYMKWLLVLAALTALVGCLLAGCGEQEAAAPATEYKIAWNTDGTVYYGEDGMTTRLRGGDYYRARFAIDGEQVDLFFPDIASMSLADKYPFVALTYDENYVVTDCKNILDVTGGLGSWNYHIQSVTDTEIVCNSAANFKGVPVTIRVDENTKVYDIGGQGLLIGLPGTAQPGGRVYSILNHDGVATHLFVSSPFQQSPVYWNVTRMYDSTAKMTTRTRDAVGYYVYDMVVDGQAVQFKTMDNTVANSIDSFGAKCMHLTFNEDGTIAEAKHARFATGGLTAASWYHVLEYTSIDRKFTAEKFAGSDKGSSGTWTLANDCKIYDMSGKGAYVGEPTDLRVYDQIHGLTNTAGEVCVLFIVSRSADLDLYYNLERMWNSSAAVSTRKADADGWYHFNFSVNGEHVALKTQDPEVVHAIDERAARVLGLELEGDVIKSAHKPSAVVGRNNTAFDYTVVSEINGKEITATRNGKTYTAKISSSCEVYNVSDSAVLKGEKTSVMVGDTIYGLAGFTKEVNEIYVTKRAQFSHLYWNLDRNYDTTQKVTKRTPAEDGYYYFRFLDDGKLVTYKTNSKAMANKIDSYVAIGMQYAGDVITQVFKYDAINGLSGGGFASWKIVSSISGNTIVAGTDKGTMSSRVKVYNVSASAITPGELTEVRVGDRIHGVKDDRGKIMYIFVVGRAIEADLHYNLERKWDDTAKTTTRTPDADGYYYLDMAANGKQVTLKTDNIDVVNTIDGRAAKVLGLVLDGNVIRAAYKPADVSGSETTAFDYSKVTEIAEDGTITTTRDGKTYVGKPSADCEIYNVSSAAEMVGEATTVQINDTLYGFSNKNGEVTEIYVVSRIPKTQTKEGYCQVCDQQVTWNEWKGTSFGSGHYYLVKDVTVTAAALIDKNTKVCLDLCGHDVIGASTLDRIFNIYGVFNLMDEKKSDGTFDGDVITSYDNTSSTRVGNIFYVQNYAGAEFNLYGGNLISTGTVTKGKIGGLTRTVNIYDGTISGGNATGYGGSLRLEAGTAQLNIYGGTLTAGSGTANGGGVIYAGGGTVNMSGGKIVGGKVNNQGGAICLDGNSAVFNMTGGTITGGTAKNGGNVGVVKGTFNYTGGTIENGSATKGDNICVDGVSKLGLGGTITVDGVMLNGGSIVVNGLNAASKVTFSMTTPGLFATCASEAEANSLTGSFISENTALAVSASGTTLLLGEKGEEPPKPHIHCVCGGNTKNVGDHTACEDVTWEPWTGTWTSGKYYYLTEDYNCTATIAVTKDKVLNLCLNGHSFSGGTSLDRIFNVYGTVNICDHKVDGEYAGKVIAKRTNTSKTGAVFYTQNSASNGYGVFNLYGGTLTATGQMKNGGICGLGNAFNMYDGTVTGGKATTAGGNIYMENNGYSSFKMYGGTVSNGQAPTGGNIRAGNTTVISGGNVYGGTADQGADIYLNRAAGMLTLSGVIGTNGTIMDVYVVAGTVDTAELDPSVKYKLTSAE